MTIQPAHRTLPLDRTHSRSESRAAPHPAVLVGGRVRALPSRQPLLIGSAQRAGLRLSDPHVSGLHLDLRKARDGVLATDLGSTNGTWLRGEPLRSALVAPGDVLRVGCSRLLIVRQGVAPRFPRSVAWQGTTAGDPVSLATLEAVAGAASGSAPVLLQGESGTGKERAAHGIHAASARSKGPLVALNCASLPANLAEAELFGVKRGAFTGADADRPGAFHAADGGVLFLDEVGELPPAVQATLLRVLETGQVRRVGSSRGERVDVRIVAASWRDLAAEVAAGRFRFDLLQRLQVILIRLPTLGERRGDIGPLLAHFLELHDAEWLWPHEALLDRIRAADWPGNVRQLHTQVRRAVLSGDPHDLLPPSPGGNARRLPRRGSGLADLALANIQEALRKARGNRSQAARLLGISRSTLYRWLRGAG